MSFPANIPNIQSDPSFNTSQILGFMRKFGYLDSSLMPTTSETIYHEEAIIAAIKNMQKYGALNETGVLDSETLKLLTAPRCGVPDIPRGSSTPTNNRLKRFVLASKGWQKRRITYFISNWSPKVGEENVAKGMKQAFELWSKYSGLQFERVYHSNADIIVAFGSGFHGDPFPFDGAGGILAHAFFPYEMSTWGGDIHFDNDENWKENASRLGEGVDFRSVAVHELGHSLGLAHSSAFSSIMFPYYKGPEETKDLDYDDILAMYELYIKSGVSVNDPYSGDENDVDRTTATTVRPTTTATRMTTTTSTGDKLTTLRYVEITTESETKSSKNIETTTSQLTDTITKKSCDTVTMKHRFSLPVKCNESPKSTDSLPQNLCESLRFDAIAALRGEIFIFKGKYVWRFTEEFQLVPGYPIPFDEIFLGIPSHVEKIDAAYERNTDGAIILFNGKMFWVFDGYSFIENSPRSITEYGFDEDVQKVDAAMVWSKNDRTYLFSGMKFVRFDEEQHHVDQGYPMNIGEKWRGIPNNLDGSISISNEKTFFFKGDLFWLYDNHWIHPQRDYPKRTSITWLGCSI